MSDQTSPSLSDMGEVPPSLSYAAQNGHMIKEPRPSPVFVKDLSADVVTTVDIKPDPAGLPPVAVTAETLQANHPDVAAVTAANLKARSAEPQQASLAEADRIVGTKTGPKVTLAQIEEAISGCEYLVHGTLTICIMVMMNGYRIVGSAASASPENFDESVGRAYARDNCIRQLWPLMGYALRERLWRESSRNGMLYQDEPEATRPESEAMDENVTRTLP